MEWYERELLPSDADSVLDAFRSNKDMARQGHVIDKATAESYIQRLLGHDHRTRVAVERGSDHVVALVAAQIDAANANAWVFYWAHARVRRTGITTSLVRRFCNDLLTGGLYRLELGFRADNIASGRVADRAGFVREGRERSKFLIEGTRVDVVTCGRLASDPWPLAADAR